MKKLNSDATNWAMIGTINDLIDKVEALSKVITRDIVRIASDDIIKELSDEPIDDYYRTVELKIPRDLSIAEAIMEALGYDSNRQFLPTDSNLKKLIQRQKLDNE